MNFFFFLNIVVLCRRVSQLPEQRLTGTLTAHVKIKHITDPFILCTSCLAALI